jgi:hypothetical protein
MFSVVPLNRRSYGRDDAGGAGGSNNGSCKLEEAAFI